ncbi:mucin-2 isoform X2 [Dendrobates tinctorius]|uniref:mucin-2 isoform X2 n=1 Tax=Dendrobates tinctorius TaxID=92724 RepID=UPI003CCA3C42
MGYFTASLGVLWLALGISNAIDVISGRIRNHGHYVCSTWGNYHFKTFDGDFYQFPGSCSYNLVSDCGDSYPEFSVHVHRSEDSGHPLIDKITVTIKDVTILLESSIAIVNGDLAKTPYYSFGIHIQKNDEYYKLYTKTGLTLMWNKEDAVMVELSAKFNNRTCGLCGDYNGVPFYNEFYSQNILLSPIQFGNLQNIHDPKDDCTDIDETQKTDTDHCYKYRSLCELHLSNQAFTDCETLLNTESYIQACMLDMCSCDHSQDSFCLCSTITEYSRQCSHAGGRPGNWRTPNLCPKQCPANMVYQESASPCKNSCSHLEIHSLCEEHYMDGCFCPEGTVQDDYTNKGCVQVSECHCKHRDTLYAPGQSVQTDCDQCHCAAGRWSCTDRACPGVCSIEGGAHFNTFDGKTFTFHGNCYYVLSKEFASDSHVILGELTPCSSLERETCLKSVVFLADNKKNVVVFKADGTTLFNELKITLPHITASFTILQPLENHIIVQADNGLQMQIQLSPTMQLYITMPKSARGRLQGLCGDFNSKEGDDFKTSGGLVEATASAFANTWKADASCHDASDWLDDPCSLSIENKNYADFWCSKLENDESPFAKCHSTIDPTEYAKRCRYDSCNCKDSEHCMCAALSTYVRACAAKGIILWGWKNGICDMDIKSCVSSQVYLYNLTTCQPTCQSLAEGEKSCASVFTPIDGCGCPEGEYLNEKDQCVDISQCSCYYQGTYVDPLDVIYKHDERCSCHNGKLHCTTHVDETCPESKVYFSCNNHTGVSIHRSCKTMGVDYFQTECISGCVCPNGLLDDGAGGCVPEEMCPCIHNEDIYPHGSQIRVDCNTCSCNRGRWTCTNAICYGTCTIYGNGHYITFDEKFYDFDGNCEFVAAQDYCGSHNSVGNFSIISENIPCGTTGVTCSKSIKVFLGSTVLKLADKHIEETVGEGAKSVKYLTREVGIYLVIEASNGILLIWDRKTTIFIKVSPAYKGKLCGLCGNFDDNAQNDFKTSHMLQVTDVLEFGNSWKVDSSCPDASDVVDPCSKNPHRHSWAEKQCGLIKSQVFKVCHSKVDPIPFYEACVLDACSCDTGGDCECFCTAVAAYAQECTKAEACVYWRTPDICPIFCDYYNPTDECEWHYHPCGNHSIQTCRSINNVYTNVTITYLEGCYPTCPEDRPIFDESNRICVTEEECGCYINNTHYEIGEEVPPTETCTTCICTTDAKVTCSYNQSACFCIINGTRYEEGEIISKEEQSGICIEIRCENGTEKVYFEVCPMSVPTTTSTTTISTTPIVSTTTVITTTPLTSTPPPSSTCVYEKVCRWTEWYDVSKPGTDLGSGDYETYDEIRKHHDDLCKVPEQIQCRAVNAPDVSLNELNQVVYCNVSYGLVCRNSDQNSENSLWSHCYNYEIRVDCCDYECALPTTTTPTTTTTSTTTTTPSTTTPPTTTPSTTTPSTTTSPTTTPPTTTPPTTTPPTTTPPTTTPPTTTPPTTPPPTTPSTVATPVETTTETPTPTTTSTTSETTTSPTPTPSVTTSPPIVTSTTPTTTSTTSVTMSPTTTTSVTPSPPSVTTTGPTPTHGCNLDCKWTEWFDASYPKYEPDGGDYETYDNIRDKGHELCEKPENISCRVVKVPDIPLDQVGQILTCDVSTGLICHNKDQTGHSPVCYNYEISVCCPPPLPDWCKTTTTEITTTTSTTTTTTESTPTPEPPTSTTISTTSETTTSPTPTPSVTTSPPIVTSTTPTTTSTTSLTTTMSPTTSTSVTTSPTVTTTGSTPTDDCNLDCKWTEWFDVSYPKYEPDGGDYETYDNIRDKGYALCEKPENISCRVVKVPNIPLDQVGQILTCDVSTGLICHNKEQTGHSPVCYNYEISVCCPPPLPDWCKTTTTEITTTTRTTTTTTESTTTESTPTPESPTPTSTSTTTETTTTSPTTTTSVTTSPPIASSTTPPPSSTTSPSTTTTTSVTTSPPIVTSTTPPPTSTTIPTTTTTTSVTTSPPIVTSTTPTPTSTTSPTTTTSVTTSPPIVTSTTPPPTSTTIPTTTTTTSVTTSPPIVTSTTPPPTSTTSPTTTTSVTTSPIATSSTPTTTSTTPGTTTTSPTTTTSATTSTPIITTTGSTTCNCNLDCKWTEWFDVSYPKFGADGGDFETYDKIRDEGHKLCKKPENISCRAEKFPDKPLDQVGQIVTCDISTGLICYNKDQSGIPVCYNYQISVCCPPPLPDCCQTSTPKTTTTTSTTTTTTESTTTTTETTTPTPEPPTPTSTSTTTETTTTSPTTTTSVTTSPPIVTSTTPPPTSTTSPNTTTTIVTSPPIVTSTTPPPTSTTSPTTISVTTSPPIVTSTTSPPTSTTSSTTTSVTTSPPIVTSTTPPPTSTTSPTTTTTTSVTTSPPIVTSTTPPPTSTTGPTTTTTTSVTTSPPIVTSTTPPPTSTTSPTTTTSVTTSPPIVTSTTPLPTSTSPTTTISVTTSPPIVTSTTPPPTSTTSSTTTSVTTSPPIVASTTPPPTSTTSSTTTTTTSVTTSPPIVTSTTPPPTSTTGPTTTTIVTTSPPIVTSTTPPSTSTTSSTTTTSVTTSPPIVTSTTPPPTSTTSPTTTTTTSVTTSPIVTSSTPTTTSTTPETTTTSPTTTTSVTTSTPIITTTGSTICNCNLDCKWTEWFDVSYPKFGADGGDFETYDKIRDEGHKLCEKPENISCRAEKFPDKPLDQVGQIVTCDISTGLICYNKDQSGIPVCYNYQISVCCPPPLPDCCQTSTPKTTTTTSTTTTTTESTTTTTETTTPTPESTTPTTTLTITTSPTTTRVTTTPPTTETTTQCQTETEETTPIWFTTTPEGPPSSTTEITTSVTPTPTTTTTTTTESTTTPELTSTPELTTPTTPETTTTITTRPTPTTTTESTTTPELTTPTTPETTTTVTTAPTTTTTESTTTPEITTPTTTTTTESTTTPKVTSTTVATTPTTTSSGPTTFTVHIESPSPLTGQPVGQSTTTTTTSMPTSTTHKSTIIIDTVTPEISTTTSTTTPTTPEISTSTTTTTTPTITPEISTTTSTTTPTNTPEISTTTTTTTSPTTTPEISTTTSTTTPTTTPEISTTTSTTTPTTTTPEISTTTSTTTPTNTPEISTTTTTTTSPTTTPEISTTTSTTTPTITPEISTTTSTTTPTTTTPEISTTTSTTTPTNTPEISTTTTTTTSPTTTPEISTTTFTTTPTITPEISTTTSTTIPTTTTPEISTTTSTTTPTNTPEVSTTTTTTTSPTTTPEISTTTSTTTPTTTPEISKSTTTTTTPTITPEISTTTSTTTPTNTPEISTTTTTTTSPTTTPEISTTTSTTTPTTTPEISTTTTSTTTPTTTPEISTTTSTTTPTNTPEISTTTTTTTSPTTTPEISTTTFTTTPTITPEISTTTSTTTPTTTTPEISTTTSTTTPTNTPEVSTTTTTTTSPTTTPEISTTTSTTTPTTTPEISTTTSTTTPTTTTPEISTTTSTTTPINTPEISTTTTTTTSPTTTPEISTTTFTTTPTITPEISTTTSTTTPTTTTPEISTTTSTTTPTNTPEISTTTTTTTSPTTTPEISTTTFTTTPTITPEISTTTSTTTPTTTTPEISTTNSTTTPTNTPEISTTTTTTTSPTTTPEISTTTFTTTPTITPEISTTTSTSTPTTTTPEISTTTSTTTPTNTPEISTTTTTTTSPITTPEISTTTSTTTPTNTPEISTTTTTTTSPTTTPEISTTTFTTTPTITPEISTTTSTSTPTTTTPEISTTTSTTTPTNTPEISTTTTTTTSPITTPEISTTTSTTTPTNTPEISTSTSTTTTPTATPEISTTTTTTTTTTPEISTTTIPTTTPEIITTTTPTTITSSVTTTPEIIISTETTIKSSTVCVCLYNGKPYLPGETVASGVANGTWCYEVICTTECIIHVNHWNCYSSTTQIPSTSTPEITTESTTTRPTTHTSEISTLGSTPTTISTTTTTTTITTESTPTPKVTTTPVSTTSTISTPKETTTTPTTTKKSTTTSMVVSTSKKPGCPFEPYREHNETWFLCNCTMARCLENNTVEIIELKCEPPPKPRCANGLQPIAVPDDDLCCWHWECDCVCNGWGDPHYVTFDGTYYSYQGNCTYTLVEEIEKRIDNFGVYIDNVDCGARDRVSCPRDIIVSHETQLIRIKATSLMPISLQVLVNDEIVGTPYKKYGVKVYTSGINYVVEIPELEANITYNGLSFSVKLPYRLFGHNTQGQCGTCTNNTSDDCRLPDGTVISNCEIMADSWVVSDPRKPECDHLRPTVAPKVTVPSTQCKPSPLCELLLQEPFKECHKTLSPDAFYKACNYDSCHVPNSNMKCTSLQQYAFLCGDQGVCIDWRSRTSECSMSCPSHKVYNACGQALPKTCATTPEEEDLNKNNNRLVEGCFCPKDTMPFSDAVDVCVQNCGCVGPDNIPREFGEEFEFDCQDCVCREGGSGITCQEHKCKPLLKDLTCELDGFQPVILISPTDSCCNETVCKCDTKFCSTKSPNCDLGYEIVGSIPDGHCCPVYTCVRKNVCVHGNAEYMPGAPVFSDKCQDCVCAESESSPTGLEITCTHVPCNVQCPMGYELKKTEQDCCGVCEQTHCILNQNGVYQLMKPDEIRNAENDNCTLYSCTRIRKQFITSISQISCPLFNEASCEPGTIQFLPNGCCKVCIEKTSSCQLKINYDYLLVNNCRSENKVQTSRCDGTCGTYSMYSADARAMSHRCTCCQEVQTSQKNVKLLCPDGSDVDHGYIDVEKCDCISTDCGHENANEYQSPVRARRAARRKGLH